MKRVEGWFDALGGSWLLVASMWLLGCGGTVQGSGTTPGSLAQNGAEAGALTYGPVESVELDLTLDAPHDWSATSMGTVLVLAPGGAQRDSVALVIAAHAADRDPVTEMSGLLEASALQLREGPVPYGVGESAHGTLTVYESGAQPALTRVESYRLAGFDDLLVALVIEAPLSDTTRETVARMLASLRRTNAAPSAERSAR